MFSPPSSVSPALNVLLQTQSRSARVTSTSDDDSPWDSAVEESATSSSSVDVCKVDDSTKAGDHSCGSSDGAVADIVAGDPDFKKEDISESDSDSEWSTDESGEFLIKKPKLTELLARQKLSMVPPPPSLGMMTIQGQTYFPHQASPTPSRPWSIPAAAAARGTTLSTVNLAFLEQQSRSRLHHEALLQQRHRQKQRRMIPKIERKKATAHGQQSGYGMAVSNSTTASHPMANTSAVEVIRARLLPNNLQAKSELAAFPLTLTGVTSGSGALSPEESMEMRVEPGQMIYEQQHDAPKGFRLPVGLTPEQSRAIEKELAVQVKRRATSSVTRALLSKRGLQPSLVGSKLGQFFTFTSREFNARAAKINPAGELERDGDGIASANAWPIFKDHKLGGFRFKHAIGTTDRAANSFRRSSIPNPDSPSTPELTANGGPNGAPRDGYERDWVKLDSFYPVWSQDEWGNLTVRDLHVWVSF